MTWTNDDFLPAQPLLDAIPSWQRSGFDVYDHYAAMGGVKAALPHRLERAVYRIRKSGRVTWMMADEIAVALGYHPAEIYGDAWWVE